MFFRADRITLNTPHTTGKFDKIIFRTIKQSGLSLGLSEVGGPKISLIILLCAPCARQHRFNMTQSQFRKEQINKGKRKELRTNSERTRNLNLSIQKIKREYDKKEKQIITL